MIPIRVKTLVYEENRKAKRLKFYLQKFVLTGALRKHQIIGIAGSELLACKKLLLSFDTAHIG